MKVRTQVSILALGLGLVVTAMPALAAETAYGTFTPMLKGTSDYRYRGISRSDEHPAIQGALDWKHNSGFYAGAFASSVDLPDSDAELDAHAGYMFDVGNGLMLGGGARGYWFPGASDTFDYDYWEVEGKSLYALEMLKLEGLLAWSPDYFGTADDSVYLEGRATAPIAETGFYVDAAYGYDWIDQGVDYSNWSVGGGYNWRGFDIKAEYVDTDLSTGQCGASDICDATGILSVGINSDINQTVVGY